MKRSAQLFAVGLLCVVGVVASARADENVAPLRSAEDARAAAKLLKDRGATAFNRGDLKGALEDFQRAYRVFPSPSLRYNIGIALDMLGRDVEAITELEAFLAEAHDAPPDARADTEAQLALLRARVGQLVITVDVPGAEVSLDERPVGKAPLVAPMPVAPGHHIVRVTSDGRRAFVSSVDVGAGETRRVDVVLPKSDSATATAPPVGAESVVEERSAPPTASVPMGGRKLLAPLLVAGTAAASAGIGLGLFVTARGEHDCLKAGGPGCAPPNTRSDLRVRQGEAMENAAYLLFAVGGVLAVADVVLWLLRSRGAPREPQAWIAPSANGLVAGARF